jgi:hypothetical protein
VSGASDSNDVPSLSDTPVPDDIAIEELDEEVLMIEFAECLRSEGLEVTDPSVDSDGKLLLPELVEGESATKQEWEDAYDVCGEIIEGITLEEAKKDISGEVEFYIDLAICMTEAGYDLEEPTTENLEAWMNDMKDNLDWNDSDLLAAYEECAGDSDGSGK